MIMIREARLEDLPELRDIYNHAILHTTATFDLIPQTLEERAAWFHKYGGNKPLLVAEMEGRIAGYSCLSVFRDKAAFQTTTEHSVYVAEAYRGRGIGKLLLKEIVVQAEQLGYHTIIGVITSGNEVSVHMHRELGFEYKGSLKEVGYKFDQWLDVDFYQLVFPKR